MEATPPKIIAGIRATPREILVVDKKEFDLLFTRAMPCQRCLEITLAVPAVFKDGTYYIPEGSLEWKMKGGE